MIKTVVFDIGQVLIKFHFQEHVNSLFGEEIGRRLTSAMLDSGYWNELDEGIRSEEDILESMYSVEPALKKEIREAFVQIARAMDRQEYAIPWIKELKEKGYQVLFLSNYSKHVMQSKWEVLDFLPYMDGGVFSCLVKKIKPDPAIYRILLEKYHLNPAECLFVDDREDNIEAAKGVGMQGIVFEGPESIETVNGFLEADKKNSVGSMKSYLIKDTTKSERIELIKQWINDDESLDDCGIDLWDMYDDYIKGIREISEINMSFQGNFYEEKDLADNA